MKSNEIGQLGEKVVVEDLLRAEYRILATNYRKKAAEIDIIAVKEGKVSFIEVKTVSHGTIAAAQAAVSHGTRQPEDLVDRKKVHKISLGADIWRSETGYTGEYQIVVAAAHIVPQETWAIIKYIENIY